MAALLLIGCATQQVDPRLGQELPNIGLVVGVGRANGQEWMVGTTVERNVICNTLYVDDAAQSTTCSGLEVTGTNDLGVSGKRGQPNLIAGFADGTIAWVEVSGDNTSFKAPVVPLHQLGQAGSAFGVFVPPGIRFSEIRFIDGAGNVVERQALPRITVDPGASP